MRPGRTKPSVLLAERGRPEPEQTFGLLSRRPIGLPPTRARSALATHRIGLKFRSAKALALARDWVGCEQSGVLRTKAELLLAFECSCSASLPRGARPGPLLSFAEQGAWSKKLSKSKTLRQLQNLRFCKSFACEQNRRFCYP